jgi:hypothetical protein
MGSTKNSKAALMKMVTEKRTIINAPPDEDPFRVEHFAISFDPAADMKLGAFLPLVGFSSCGSSAQL